MCRDVRLVTDAKRSPRSRSAPLERPENATPAQTVRPGRAPLKLSRRALRLLALLVEDVLEPLRRRDLDGGARRDLDLLARRRVAADARLAIDELHRAQTAERDLALVLEALRHDILDRLE